MKRRALLLIAAIAFLGACGIEVGDVRVGPTPICDSTSRGLLILMAQAVPSAELIPCLNSLPDGWAMERADVETDSAELSIDGGNVGDVEIELEMTCEPTGAALGDNSFERATYEAATDDEFVRYYIFSGGCVTITAPNSLAAREMTSEISFITRNELRNASGLEL